MNGPKDMHGTELNEGDFVHDFLPLGCNYVAGKIVKITQGGLAMPNGPKDTVTAGQIEVMCILRTAFVPGGGNIGHLVKLAVAPAPATPEEKAHVDKVLSLYPPPRKTAGS